MRSHAVSRKSPRGDIPVDGLTTNDDSTDPAPLSILFDQARMRLLFEQAPMAVSVVRGAELVFELANAPYEQMVGRPVLVGRSFREVFPELAEDAPVLSMLANVVATGKTFHASEYPVLLDRTGTGKLEEAFFLFTCRPFHEGNGVDDAILTVAVDVTEQVKMRRRIEALSLEREQLFAKEKKARADAEAANRAKDEFLAMLGHELRNPLAPITTALDLLHQRGATFEKEHLVIERQVEHLKRLVDDLLDIARIKSGRLELRRARVRVADVITKAIDIAAPLFETRQHHLEIGVAEDLAIVGDAMRLSQVVANLLINAAKYTNPGGRIAVSAMRDGATVKIRVKDNGIGIAPDILPHVFDSFVQESQSIDRSRGGLGLGLTIVRTIVSLHEGSVAVESAGEGQGSAFTVTLPVEGEVTPMPFPRESTTALTRAPRRVLIVDDNVDAAELLGDWFRDRGDEVHTVYDGLDAIDAAGTFLPDVVLLDIGLPGMDGYEVARELRKQPDRGEVVLVAITGYGQASDRARSAEAGFDHHFVKPIDVHELDTILA